MTTKTRLSLLAVLMLGIASAAQAGSGHHGASNRDFVRIHLAPTVSVVRASARQPSMNAPSRQSTTNALTCPWLEGYPDCHPNAGGF